MSDALVDLGIQDALRYVHVNILPSVVLVCRDVAHIVVITVSCVFFAWSLARASSLFGAAWVFAKATAALSAFQLVWARVVDPFVYDKTREYVELCARHAAEEACAGLTPQALKAMEARLQSAPSPDDDEKLLQTLRAHRAEVQQFLQQGTRSDEAFDNLSLIHI